MRASLAAGTLVLELGTSFTTVDAERARETFEAFAPVRQLTLDFSAVRRCDDPALTLLGEALAAHPATCLVVRGLDHRRRYALVRTAAAEGPR